jgi:hypothetical protein
MGDLEHNAVRGFVKTFNVLFQFEDNIVIGAYPFKYAVAVEKPVVINGNFRLRSAEKLAVYIYVGFLFHDLFPLF